MSYAQTLANALEAEGIPTARADGTPLSQDDLVNAFIAKHEKKGGKASPKDTAKGSGQARKQPKVSADASGQTKAEFFAAHRDDVKKTHKSPKDCRQELMKMWNEHLKKKSDKPAKPEKKEGEGKKKADAPSTTSPKQMYHKFDEALSDEQATEWNLKKIGVMGEKHVYVANTPSPNSAAKPSPAKSEKKDGAEKKDAPTPSGKRKIDEVASSGNDDSTSIAIDQITSWLMSLDQNTLKLNAAKIGKPTSGTKKDLVDHILNDIKATRISDKLIAQKKLKPSESGADSSAAIDVDDDDDDAAADEEEEEDDDSEEESEEEEDEEDEDEDDEEDDDSEDEDEDEEEEDK